MRLLNRYAYFPVVHQRGGPASCSWRNNIRDAENAVYLSVVAVWEAIVKHRLGQLPLPHPLGYYLPTQRVRHQMGSLPLDEASVCQLATLPPVHPI